MQIQEWIVALLVAVALGFILRKIIRTARGAGCCHGGDTTPDTPLRCAGCCQNKRQSKNGLCSSPSCCTTPHEHLHTGPQPDTKAAVQAPPHGAADAPHGGQP